MKGLVALLGFVLFVALITLSVPYASAANFTASISPTSVNGSLSSRMFNLTINNTDSTEKVIIVNTTLPSGFTFVMGSNQTSAGNNTFYNSTVNLTWSNTTIDEWFIENGTSEYFVFNSSTPNSSGNYTITVTIYGTQDPYTLYANSTTLDVTVDADAPTVSLSYPGNNTAHKNSTMTFNFTATDSIDANLTCNLTIDGSVNQSGFGAESGNITSRTVYGLDGGQHSWNVTCWDDFDHATTSNTSFFSISTDLTVTKIDWNSTDNNHPFTGSNVTINATINNTGDFNFTGDMEAWLYWDGSKVANKTVSNSTLTNGKGVTVIFDEVTSDSLVTNGIHTIIVEADALNNVTEHNETNNNKSLRLVVGYNVTILGFEYNGTPYTSPYLKANDSFSINVSVEYGNGDPVNGLSEANFTHVYDNHGGDAAERDWGASGYQGTSLSNFTNVSSGRYSFEIVTYYNPTDPRPGVHNLTVTAEKGSYSGSSEGVDYYYLLVPSFTVSFSSLLTSINEEYVDGFNVLATNNGNDTLYNAGASIIDNHDYISFTSCSGSINLTNTSNPQTVCSSTMTASAVTGDKDGGFQVNVSGRSNGLLFYTLSSWQYVTVLDADTGDGGGPPSGPTGCTTDADCASGYYCSNGVCVKKTYSIAITSYTSSLEVNWSSYVTTKVTVKNDGSNSFTAKLSVTLSGLDVTVLPTSMTLDPGNAIMFTVNISVPETTSLGDYSGTFKAYVNEDTSVYQTKTFTLTILSTPEKEREVNESYHNYSAIYDELKERLERLRTIGFINESDIEEIESLLNGTYDDLDEAKDALDEGDYSTADSILALMNASLNNIESKIVDLELQQEEEMGGEWTGIWFWVVIGVVVVIVIGFLVYLLMPSFKGYHPRYGYRPVIKEGFFEKLGKRFKRKPKRMIREPEKPREEYRPAYREGYEKVVSGYKRERGVFSKIKEKFRRKKKQKEVSEYFGSG